MTTDHNVYKTTLDIAEEVQNQLSVIEHTLAELLIDEESISPALQTILDDLKSVKDLSKALCDQLSSEPVDITIPEGIDIGIEIIK